MVFWIPLMIIAALFLATIAWSAIETFFEENVNDNSKYVTIIRERIADGNVKVIAGVFDSRDNVTATQAWEGEKLDEELENIFGQQDQITHML